MAFTQQMDQRTCPLIGLKKTAFIFIGTIPEQTNKYLNQTNKNLGF